MCNVWLPLSCFTVRQKKCKTIQYSDCKSNITKFKTIIMPPSLKGSTEQPKSVSQTHAFHKGVILMRKNIDRFESEMFVFSKQWSHTGELKLIYHTFFFLTSLKGLQNVSVHFSSETHSFSVCSLKMNYIQTGICGNAFCELQESVIFPQPDGKKKYSFSIPLMFGTLKVFKAFQPHVWKTSAKMILQ